MKPQDNPFIGLTLAALLGALAGVTMAMVVLRDTKNEEPDPEKVLKKELLDELNALRVEREWRRNF